MNQAIPMGQGAVHIRGTVTMQTHWTALAALTLARTTMGVQFQSVAALAPLIAERHNLGGAGLGALIGLYLMPGVFLALPGGWLGQRFGDVRLVVLGLALMTLGGLAGALTGLTLLLFVARLAAGAGAILLNVLVTKMVADRFPGRDAPTAMGILISSWPLGLALAMIVLPPLAVMSPAAALLLPAAFAALSVLMVALVFPLAAPPPGTDSRSPAVTRSEAARATLAGAVWTSFNAGLILVIAFAPAALIERGTDPAAAAAMVSLVGWLVIPSVAAGGWLIANLPRPNLLFYGCLATAALLAALATTPAAGVVLFVLLGLIIGPPGPMIMTLPAAAAPPEKRGMIMGIYFTCYYIGMSVIPPVAGWLWDVTGSADVTLWFAAILLLITAAARAAFARSTRTSAGQAA